MEIISRSDAKALGLKRFFTAKPCIRGHVAERIVSNKACVECAAIRDRAYKEANRVLLRDKARERNASNKEYARKYYLDNKEKYKERSDRRYREKRDEILEAQRKRIRENPERRRIIQRAYRERNAEKVANTLHKNYIKNREAILRRQRNAYNADPSKATAKAAMRRTRKAAAVLPWHSELDAFVWSEAADLVRIRSELSGFSWASDHMIPIAGKKARGLHVWNNCQVIPAKLNLWKNNKHVLTERLEWLDYM